MARRNRVTPFGGLVDAGRGLVYGNRGCLHDRSGVIRRHHNGKRWISCRLETLPDGTFVVLDEAAFLVLGDRLLRWAPRGHDVPWR